MRRLKVGGVLVEVVGRVMGVRVGGVWWRGRGLVVGGVWQRVVEVGGAWWRGRG